MWSALRGVLLIIAISALGFGIERVAAANSNNRNDNAANEKQNVISEMWTRFRRQRAYDARLHRMAEEQAEAQWRLARNDANNPRDLTDVTKRQQQSVEEHFHKLKADFARAQLNAPRAEAATASPSLGNAHARAVTGDAVQARMAESAENKRLRDEAESIVLKRWAHLEQDAGALSTERAINRNALIQKQTEQEFLRLLKKSIDSQIR